MLAASNVQHRGHRPRVKEEDNSSSHYHGDEHEDGDAEDCWTDPNLTEPKLQDAFDRCRHQRPQQRRRPQAARGSKSAPHQENEQQQQMAQIRYFKYIPYQGMSEPDRRKYLSLGTARLTSSRTEPVTRRSTAAKQQQRQQQDSAAAAFWQSGSKAKSLKVYDYHLAELSMAYRSPPSLLGRPRRFTPPPTPQQQQQREQVAQESHKSLFYQLHANRMLPATAPSATQQQLMAADTASTARAEKTTQVSRGGTPFIDSAMSGDYQHPPAEPRDIVSKSASNRLLNVVSVDECHVNHRRRRRRLRRVGGAEATGTTPRDAAEDDEDEEAEEEEEGEEADEEVEYHEGDAAEDNIVDLEGQEQQKHQLDWIQKTDSPPHHREPSSPVPVSSPTTIAAAAAAVAASAAVAATAAPATTAATAAAVVATRPTTDRSSKKSKRRTEQEMRRLAAAKFLRRNEILREKISIYLDWKLDRERFGREVAGCGGCASDWRLLAELREGDAATRFERFTAELVHQEALVANQYRSSGGPTEKLDGAAGDEETAAPMSQYNQQHQRQQEQQQHQESPTGGVAMETGERRAELSLTEMFDVLNV